MHRGFTFLEVVLSITILVLIMGVTYGALNQITRAKKLLDDSRDSKFIADAILSRFTRELQLAYPLGSVIPPPQKKNQPYPGQPPLFGESKGKGQGEGLANVTFLALEGGQYLPDGGTHTGVVQISYRAEKDPEDPSSKTLVLVRDEMPNTKPYDLAYKKRMTFPITKSLVELSFRYFDCKSETWSDDWGTPPRTGFPSLIHFNFTLRSPMGRDESFATTLYIPASAQTQQCP